MSSGLAGPTGLEMLQSFLQDTVPSSPGPALLQVGPIQPRCFPPWGPRWPPTALVSDPASEAMLERGGREHVRLQSHWLALSQVGIPEPIAEAEVGGSDR